MSKEAQRVYLTSLMNDRVGDFAFPIALPNQSFNIPTNTPYGEFHVIAGPRPVVIAGHGKGKALVRYVGFVQLTIWLPNDKGMKAGALGEDIFKKIFQFRQGRDEANSTYKFGAQQDFTPQTKAGWECVVVRVPFQRDTVEEVMIGMQA